MHWSGVGKDTRILFDGAAPAVLCLHGLGDGSAGAWGIAEPEPQSREQHHCYEFHAVWAARLFKPRGLALHDTMWKGLEEATNTPKYKSRRICEERVWFRVCLAPLIFTGIK